MSGDYWDAEFHGRALDERLRTLELLWDVVYSRIESAYADIEAGRPSLDDIENGKAVTQEVQGANEVSILREATYEVVQAALVYLRP